MNTKYEIVYPKDLEIGDKIVFQNSNWIVSTKYLQCQGMGNFDWGVYGTINLVSYLKNPPKPLLPQFKPKLEEKFMFEKLPIIRELK